MKLGPHGKLLVDFVMAYVDGEMERFDFDMDYSGYVIAHFPGFEEETPRLAARFASSIDRAYSTCGRLRDDAFIRALSAAVDDFLGTDQLPDID